ncbi:hypothetical protein [Flavivirga rizhaonensis]|uniref:Uncharacterized protein n=1 Tax=Flavivirga rizhaonensis TaxID=2559571 RepID=A0A4V3P4K5_9FLAO|nr:hypothetical protein [Flavivirga rizhaonensis]TGV01804.1 hypothetical protein EM932_14110 [Flavivirga rizhaonensis]
MKKELFIEVFKNIQDRKGYTTKNSIVKYLSNQLLKYNITGISDRNLTRYFDKYIDGNDDPINPKVELLDAISKELSNQERSYESYEDYVFKNRKVTEEDKSNKNIGTRAIHQQGKNNIYLENNSGPLKFS